MNVSQKNQVRSLSLSQSLDFQGDKGNHFMMSGGRPWKLKPPKQERGGLCTPASAHILQCACRRLSVTGTPHELQVTDGMAKFIAITRLVRL